MHQLTMYKLIAAYQRVLQRFELSQLDLRHTVVQYPFTLESEKESIIKKISVKASVSFEELFESCTSKIHAVFIFLALLDLLQIHEVSINVGEGFNNFVLQKPQDLFTHADRE